VSVYAFYRRLIELRHENPVVVHGDFTMLIPGHPQLYAFTRSLNDESLLVLVNVSDDTVTLPEETLPEELTATAAEPVIGNYPEPGALRNRLRPWEAIVWKVKLPS
jgi:oligo-1,6-glucosidase